MDTSNPEPNNVRTRVSYKRRRPVYEVYQRNVKHTKESNHWLYSTSTFNRYAALLDEENEHQQQDGPGNTPKLPPIHVSHVTTISLLIQRLEQIAQQYELKALSNTYIRIKPSPKPLNLIEQSHKP
jgi:hypothetical protein